MRLILTLEYDGTPFRGWAAQPGLPTIEAALRQALGETFASVENLAVAGRTDTGVHALGQVASVQVTFTHEVARPAMNAKRVSCEASTTAKIGASVDSEPSMSPTIAGWTRCRRKVCSSDIS